MSKQGRGKPWTRDELILAINLYCKTPFGRIHIHNPEIIELANALGRTPGSISYKLANFASIDPSLNRSGASHASKLDHEVWGEFFADWSGMAFESEQRMSDLLGKKSVEAEQAVSEREGITRQTVAKARVNQQFFRKMILSSYDSRCCITGLPLPSLLVASHIVPWSVGKKHRLNPRNGLCLNALHDKAFDTGSITLDDDYRIVLSQDVKARKRDDVALLADYEGHSIRLPSRFCPDPALVEYHREHVFAGS